MWDGLLDRSTEVIGAFPTVVLIALIRAIEHRPSLTSLMLAVVLVRWTEAARLTRTLVLRTLSEEWLTAARAIGASPSGIVLRHVVPNVAAPLLVSFVFSVGAIVLTETSLSFLGLGAPAEVASWGEMLAETRWGAGPRLMVLPAFALALTVGALHLVAESLRQALDPESSSRNLLL
jgi:ABC-type dipeptide/oligopeptide/nickel transport system permease subunit